MLLYFTVSSRTILVSNVFNSHFGRRQGQKKSLKLFFTKRAAVIAVSTIWRERLLRRRCCLSTDLHGKSHKHRTKAISLRFFDLTMAVADKVCTSPIVLYFKEMTNFNIKLFEMIWQSKWSNLTLFQYEIKLSSPRKSQSLKYWKIC